ncbi:hypothetical protein M5K25_017403 [Dendrobium thyrsiflorum]|uniref:Uncharacterized protein n=1 Tax=Dendrobium thyrsiflorum TaxID=117978 RepID=A0ABD0UU27_DENTH
MELKSPNQRKLLKLIDRLSRNVFVGNEVTIGGGEFLDVVHIILAFYLSKEELSPIKKVNALFFLTDELTKSQNPLAAKKQNRLPTPFARPVQSLHLQITEIKRTDKHKLNGSVLNYCIWTPLILVQ